MYLGTPAIRSSPHAMYYPLKLWTMVCAPGFGSRSPRYCIPYIPELPQLILGIGAGRGEST